MRLFIILQKSFWSNFASIKTPLALAGLFAAIIFLIARQVLKNFRPATPEQGSGLELARTILKYLFILSLVGMCLGFIGYLVPYVIPSAHGDGLSSAEREASSLEDEVVDLQKDWNGMDQVPSNRLEVLQKAPQLADQLLSLNDNDLSPAYKILKYEYAMYAYTMAASVQPDTDQGKKDKILYASKALELGRETADLIADVKRNYTTSEGYKKAMNFIKVDEVEDRVNYLSALCLCRKADVLNDASLRQQAQEAISKVSASHLETFPTERNPEFAGCLNNIGGGK